MSETEIQILKKKAKKLAKVTNKKLRFILDILAREEGYDNWKNLIKKK